MDTLQYIAPLDSSDARIACFALAVLYIVVCVVCAATEDVLYCGKCKHTMTAKKYFAYLSKKLNIVPCPCCKGNGFVKNTDRKERK